jgi:peptidoglycan/LPS O-acetylase OafA/YrhL
MKRETGSTHAQNGYRADIDGLRAVAVLSVVVHHLNATWAPGGYVGVDIFFVISGFLITRNIWGELEAGRFSLRDFYLRRIRRIAPASMLVTAATLCAGALLLQPNDLVRLAQSALWSAFSAANIYFWHYLDTSYFARASAEEPLLHLWSLGVEEQFYLVWPTLLLLLTRIKRVTSWAAFSAAAICLGSFALAEWTNVSAQKFAYYMLPPRAGELMVGALLAFSAASRPTPAVAPGRAEWLWEAVASCGFTLIAGSLYWLDSSARFPGINAAYPCLGAALVMMSGQHGARLTHTLLTARPVVYIGLISYSLYLWHWPILAFIRYFYGGVDLRWSGMAFVAMLALSAVSYRFVEQPTRHIHMPARKQLLWLLVAPLSLIAVAATALLRSDGLKSIIEASPDHKAVAALLDRQTRPANGHVYPCMDSSRKASVSLTDPRCVLGAKAGGKPLAPKVLLWGDSNAAHYIGALQTIAERDGFAFRYISTSTCAPLFGKGEFSTAKQRKRCDDNRTTVQRYLSGTEFNTVVLAAQWSVHQKKPQFKQVLNSTVRALEGGGRRVVVLGQVPGFNDYIKDCRLRWSRIAQHDRCEQRASIPDGGDLEINASLARQATLDGALDFVGVRDVLCKDGRCSPYLDHAPVYFNKTHLSAEGSAAIGRKVLASLAHDAWLAAFSEALPSGNAILVNGYRPGFPYQIRSQRHEPAPRGQFRHYVSIEYLRIDEHAVVDVLRRELEARGFKLQGPIPKENAERFVAQAPGRFLNIDVQAHPTAELAAPEARGIVHFGWRDDRRR